MLSRGLIGGSSSNDGFRAVAPRFQGANREHNDALVSRLQGIAEAKGASLAQLAIAWVAAQDDHIVPIVGSRRIEQVETMIGSNRITLDGDDLARIDELIPRGAARGDRYPAKFMADLDSER